MSPLTWLQAAAVVLLLGAVLAQPALVLLAGLLIAACAVAWGWSRISLDGVRYERQVVPDRAIAGDIVTLRIAVTNGKVVPVAQLRLHDRVPVGLEPIDAPISAGLDPAVLDLEHSTSLGWFERVTWIYDLRCSRRGHFTLGPADAESGDGFGLFGREHRFEALTRLVVLPALKPMAAFGLPPQLPLGPIRSTQRRFDDPLHTDGVRDYRPGDPIRRLHWPATAHLGKLQIRTPGPSTDWRVLVLLNGQTLPRPWQGAAADALERCVEVAAAVVSQAVRSGIPTGLVANVSAPGERQLIRVAPGVGDGQAQALLEALAAVGPFETARFESLVVEEARRVTFGGTLALVTSVIEPDLQIAITSHQRAHLRFILIACSEEAPTPIVGATVFHVPLVRPDEPIRPAPVNGAIR